MTGLGAAGDRRFRAERGEPRRVVQVLSLLSPLIHIVYHSFFSHLIGRMLCVAHACYPEQSSPIGLVYKLPLFPFLCCMPDEARDRQIVALK